MAVPFFLLSMRMVRFGGHALSIGQGPCSRMTFGTYGLCVCARGWGGGGSMTVEAENYTILICDSFYTSFKYKAGV
jgi:hypothetical protein